MVEIWAEVEQYLVRRYGLILTYLKGKPAGICWRIGCERRWRSQGQLWEFGMEAGRTAVLILWTQKEDTLLLFHRSLTDLLQCPGEKEHLDAVGPCHGFCAGYTLLACVDHYPGCIAPFPLYSGFLLYLICERHLQIRGKREEFRVVMALLQPGWAWGVTAFLH